MSDWDKTCAMCADGEIEPDCPFYGEPNGCNSPTYQHFPTGECNAKLAIQALIHIVAYWEEGEEVVERERELLRQAKAALAAPPRNCDVGTAQEQSKRFKDFCDEHDSGREFESPCAHCLLPGNGDQRCVLAWAQKPYGWSDEEE